MIDADNFIFKAIGVPFLEHGRDYNGWDCWGLVMRAYQDVIGVKLPDFSYNDTSEYRRLIENFSQREDRFWRKSDTRDFSVACIYRRGRVIHAGLSVGNKILHVERGIETCLEPASRMRIEGYYEPACLSTASI